MCSEQAKPFCLPNPDTRVVVYCGTVFKLKMRCSMPKDDRVFSFFRSDDVQKDIKKVVNMSLSRACAGLPLQPFSAGQLVFYPYVRHWPAPQELLFFGDNKPLKTCHFVIILSVEAHRVSLPAPKPVGVAAETSPSKMIPTPSPDKSAHCQSGPTDCTAYCPLTPTSDEDSCHSSCSECASSSSSSKKRPIKRKRRTAHGYKPGKRLFPTPSNQLNIPALDEPTTTVATTTESMIYPQVQTSSASRTSHERATDPRNHERHLSESCEDRKASAGKRLLRWMFGFRE